jgi:hypothetical protein
MANFITKIKPLLATLKLLKRAISKHKQKALEATVEITITDGNAQFTIPGAAFNLVCETIGTCKATIRFIQFFKVVESIATTEVEIAITENRVRIGGVTLTAQTTFFKTDAILRSIKLPINYTETDLLCLPQLGFTWEEIEFNNLSSAYNVASQKYGANLLSAYEFLKEYGIMYSDLKAFTENTILARINSEE